MRTPLSRFTMYLLVATLSVVVVGALTVPWAPPAQAGVSVWRITSLAATLNPGVSDTSASFWTQGCQNLNLYLHGEMDSMLVTVQTSRDKRTWCQLYQEQINGTDGTLALQLNRPITRLGSGGTDYFEVPTLDWVRVIANNNDTADADTASAMIWELKCRK